MTSSFSDCVIRCRMWHLTSFGLSIPHVAAFSTYNVQGSETVSSGMFVVCVFLHLESHESLTIDIYPQFFLLAQ